MKRPAEVLVVIPTRNRERLLPEAVDSVLAQEYPEVRIVLVDDGSSDGTPAVCGRYAEAHPGRILVLRAEGAGCAAARNRGLERMGEETAYVCFLDDDDRLLPGKIRREVELLDAAPDEGFVYGDAILYHEETGRESRHPAAAAGRPGDFSLEHFLTNEAKTSAILYRAEAVRGRRFREDLLHNEDSEFLQRVAMANRGIYCPEPGCWIRWHPGSKSRDLVAIHRAVLRANESLLSDYPEFHRRHRLRVDQRMEELRRALFAELALAGRWEEAREQARGALQRAVAALRVRPAVRFLRSLGVL
ncbi:MAG: glycosyl transferase, family 2 [Deltaproteobacteria bacterium]|nr:glycosyl transferase, family 2 [Deltaproteobacteria bacterium]MBP2683061.1 glycosyl transferase, family 2 [Deltaproteobacteria bacterium]